MNCAQNDQRHDRPVRVWTEARTDVNLPSILLSLWLLRVLHDESRHAGRKDLSDYCSHIEKQIVDLRLYRSSEVEGLVAKLVHITDTVHRDRLVSSSSKVVPINAPTQLRGCDAS
jgi:hypothetical protein